MIWQTREFEPDGSLMVLVPHGPFVMGLPDDYFLAEDHEKPERTVRLTAYWIDVYAVTNARYRRFLEAGGYDRAEWWTPGGWSWKHEHGIRQPAQWNEAGWDGPDQPAAGVSWYEADAYARWAGRRLPTDAEWEKAARGADRRRYPWGDAWPTHAVANFDGFVGRTTPVGLYREGASPYGCHDLAGNVNNWVSDWYWADFGRFCQNHDLLDNPHLDDTRRGQLRVENAALKVDRGGGFATPREYHEVLGCTRKVYWTPETRRPWNGFRTAREE